MAMLKLYEGYQVLNLNLTKNNNYHMDNKKIIILTRKMITNHD